MTTSNFARVAAEVQKTLGARPRTAFALVAAEVQKSLGHVAAADRDAEWQRVNSYIADVLKDTHVLYAKLARLQGDFSGEELARLSKVSEAVLTLGDELSMFSKAFYEGKYDMLQSEFTYGEDGAPVPNPKAQGGDGGGVPDSHVPKDAVPVDTYDVEGQEGEQSEEEPEEGAEEEPEEDYSGEDEPEEESKQ